MAQRRKNENVLDQELAYRMRFFMNTAAREFEEFTEFEELMAMEAREAFFDWAEDEKVAIPKRLERKLAIAFRALAAGVSVGIHNRCANGKMAPLPDERSRENRHIPRGFECKMRSLGVDDPDEMYEILEEDGSFFMSDLEIKALKSHLDEALLEMEAENGHRTRETGMADFQPVLQT
ncbi:hypothetical protein [Salipiger mucosus]|uniref:Uncharacterized protein n=1 Tax=Salipiger mucosus DSM 16094 TaxID=1123237 RepID=S9Q9R8_9RHOB|nr:hypothetical protein [Salipiger mucosus]EPX76742.1 hypothetical protein Salmuc_04627 [Salipiger mucosus DSM 16094]